MDLALKKRSMFDMYPREVTRLVNIGIKIQGHFSNLDTVARPDSVLSQIDVAALTQDKIA